MTLMKMEDTEVLGLEGSSGDPPDAGRPRLKLDGGRHHV